MSVTVPPEMMATLANSAAVVIGAGLIAPLMTPILGIAVAIVPGAARRLVVSFTLVGAGILVAVGAADVSADLAPGPGLTAPREPSCSRHRP